MTVLVTICALINEGIILTKIWYDEERGIEYNKSGVGIKLLYLASIFGMVTNKSIFASKHFLALFTLIIVGSVGVGISANALRKG